MNAKDKIRAATLGAKSQFKKTIVKYNGIEVEIRQPSIAERSQLQELCTERISNGPNADALIKVNNTAFFVWSVIKHTYVPGTDERVFDDADYETLSNSPSGGYMDKFFEIASNLTNVAVDDEKKL